MEIPIPNINLKLIFFNNNPIYDVVKTNDINFLKYFIKNDL